MSHYLVASINCFFSAQTINKINTKQVGFRVTIVPPKDIGSISGFVHWDPASERIEHQLPPLAVAR